MERKYYEAYDDRYRQIHDRNLQRNLQYWIVFPVTYRKLTILFMLLQWYICWWRIQTGMPFMHLSEIT